MESMREGNKCKIAKSISVMLSGDALFYFSGNVESVIHSVNQWISIGADTIIRKLCPNIFKGTDAPPNFQDDKQNRRLGSGIISRICC